MMGARSGFAALAMVALSAGAAAAQGSGGTITAVTSGDAQKCTIETAKQAFTVDGNNVAVFGGSGERVAVARTAPAGALIATTDGSAGAGAVMSKGTIAVTGDAGNKLVVVRSADGDEPKISTYRIDDKGKLVETHEKVDVTNAQKFHVKRPARTAGGFGGGTYTVTEDAAHAAKLMAVTTDGMPGDCRIIIRATPSKDDGN